MPPLVRFEHLGEEGGNLWSFVDEGPYVAFWFSQGEGLGQDAYGPLFLASIPQSQRLERKDLYLTAAPTCHLRRLTQPLEQPQCLVGLVLREQHPRKDKVLTLSEVARLILYTQPTLGAPAGGIVHLALGEL